MTDDVVTPLMVVVLQTVVMPLTLETRTLDDELDDELDELDDELDDDDCANAGVVRAPTPANAHVANATPAIRRFN